MIHGANAEGFSNAISPSLEYSDIDALQHSTTKERFQLTMKNEAFETHMINELALHAIPKHRKEKVFHDTDAIRIWRSQIKFVNEMRANIFH